MSLFSKPDDAISPTPSVPDKSVEDELQAQRAEITKLNEQLLAERMGETLQTLPMGDMIRLGPHPERPDTVTLSPDEIARSKAFQAKIRQQQYGGETAALEAGMVQAQDTAASILDAAADDAS